MFIRSIVCSSLWIYVVSLQYALCGKRRSHTCGTSRHLGFIMMIASPTHQFFLYCIKLMLESLSFLNFEIRRFTWTFQSFSPNRRSSIIHSQKLKEQRIFFSSALVVICRWIPIYFIRCRCAFIFSVNFTSHYSAHIHSPCMLWNHRFVIQLI